MTEFLSGAAAFGMWTAGLFFLRFWRKTKDRLFGFFAAAFWLMGVERVILAIWQQSSDSTPYVYVLRLLAYVLIIMAIMDKNRRA